MEPLETIWAARSPIRGKGKVISCLEIPIREDHRLEAVGRWGPESNSQGLPRTPSGPPKAKDVGYVKPGNDLNDRGGGTGAA